MDPNSQIYQTPLDMVCRVMYRVHQDQKKILYPALPGKLGIIPNDVNATPIGVISGQSDRTVQYRYPHPVSSKVDNCARTL